MKKLLLCTAAVAMGLALSTPAKAAADGVKLSVGGAFKGYVVWGRQSTDADGANKDRSVDILRSTDFTLSGEDTLDNGLTVGIYNEFNIDGTGGLDNSAYAASVLGGAGNAINGNPVPTSTVATKESYAYFSGAWGRTNFGKEDGANYLLQVAAPSADSNIDGLRQYINPVNYALTDAANVIAGPVAQFTHSGVRLDRWYNTVGLDYSDDLTGDYNKLTYLTPVFSGFQFGASYTPDVNNFNVNQTGLQGVHQNNGVDSFGAAWEGSGRYEGRFQNLDLTLGGGYTHVNLEKKGAVNDPFDSWKEWNFGANVGWTAFNFGTAYTQDNGGRNTGNSDSKTWVVGGDYTTGPYKLGVSYLDNKLELDSPTQQAHSHRYTGGLVYTYGPGMTFRGSVSYVATHMPTGTSNITGTDVLLGSQINF